jgi:hypothetical protein
MSTTERRTSRRWTINGNVTVEIVGRVRTLKLTNVGNGGFSVASEQPLAAIARPDFRFSCPHTGWSTVLTAQMAYCLLRPRRAGAYEGQYVTGYTFCDTDNPDVQVRVREFLAQAKPDSE